MGQHRKIATLRGNGWRQKHATVNYVFAYSPYKSFPFYGVVLREMEKRGYHLDPKWCDSLYRGQHCPAYKQLNPVVLTMPIYPEHDQGYKHVCLTSGCLKIL